MTPANSKGILRRGIAERAAVQLARLGADRASERAYIVITIATVMEAYVDETIAILVDQDETIRTGVGRLLYRKHASDWAWSWDARNEWLNGAFGINLAGTKEWQSFQTVVELRNAIVHRGTGLTQAQGAKPLPAYLALRKNLSDLRVQASVNELQISAETGSLAAQSARAFLLAMEAAVAPLLSEQAN